MGTRGLIAYRYKGVYYIKYNHMDSYPEGLGVDLVSSIPEDPEEFQLWLERKRACFTGFPKIGKFDSDDEAEEEDDSDDLDIANATEPSILRQMALYKQMMKRVPKREFELSSRPPGNSNIAGIEWTYNFDLDRLAFTVLDTLHLRLDSIPRGDGGSDWIKLMYCDGVGGICRSPYVSDVRYANVYPTEPLSEQEVADLKFYEAMHVENISASTWMDAPEEQNLVLSRHLAMITTKGLIYGNFAEVSNAHRNTKSGAFQALAKELLTSASPAGSMFSDDVKQINDWSSTIKARRTLGSVLWFRSRLVIFAKDLDQSNILNSSVGRTIRYVKERGLKECTAILWSVDHIAVVAITGDNISCSEGIPFVASFGGDEDKFTQAMRLIAHYLPPPCVEGSRYFSSRLPLDVFAHIMELMDPVDALALSRTSKALRAEWLRRPAIGRYTLLSAQDDGFTALYRERAQPVHLSIHLPKCLSQAVTDEDEDEDEDDGNLGEGEKQMPLDVVYRRSYYDESFSCVSFKLFSEHS